MPDPDRPFDHLLSPQITASRPSIDTLHHIVGEQSWPEQAAARAVEELRERGAIGELIVALEVFVQVEAHQGRTAGAQISAAEGLRLGASLHTAIFRALLALYSGRRGDRETAAALANEALMWAAPRQVRSVAARAVWALRLLELAAGDSHAAHRHLVRLASPGDVAAHFAMALV
jgi:hypothetical protein